jgi:hypothetical protein
MDAVFETVSADDVSRTWTPDPSPAAQRAWLEDAAACVRRHGVIVIRDAIPPAAVNAVLKHCQARHDVHMAPGQKKLFRSFQSDPLRAQVPIAIDGPLANPEFFAAPGVLGLARQLMGDDLIVGELGMVVSHAGAGPQDTHRDSTFLFDGVEAAIDLPPFTVTVLVQLQDTTLEMGPTEFWPDSHRNLDQAAVTAVPPKRTAIKAGSVVMMDSRILHRGGAHIEGPARAAAYLCYGKSWYLCTTGYAHKPQVRVTPAMLQRLPEAYRPLFAWALHLNRTDSFQEFIYRWIGRLRRRLV